jgi:hypothetical protein
LLGKFSTLNSSTLPPAFSRAQTCPATSHPLEHAGDDWWADVLADPRARVTTRRARDADGRSFFRLADETRAATKTKPSPACCMMPPRIKAALRRWPRSAPCSEMRWPISWRTAPTHGRNPKPPWRERKEAYLDALTHKPQASLLVSLADKPTTPRPSCSTTARWDPRYGAASMAAPTARAGTTGNLPTVSLWPCRALCPIGCRARCKRSRAERR